MRARRVNCASRLQQFQESLDKRIPSIPQAVERVAVSAIAEPRRWIRTANAVDRDVTALAGRSATPTPAPIIAT